MKTENYIKFHMDRDLSSTSHVTGQQLRKRRHAENFGLYDEEAGIIKHLLTNIGAAVCHRLDAIDRRLDRIVTKMQFIDNELSRSRYQHWQSTVDGPSSTDPPKTRIAVKDIERPVSPVSLDESLTEAEFPDGSYLGNPSNPARRVRVHITPSTLDNICTTCDNPVKMALTLLDYLFDRPTQAVSSLRGGGVHDKKKLNELLVKGIRLHLEYIFGITSSDWQEIRLSIDSKCRSAFRRKSRGLRLSPKDSQTEENPTSSGLLISCTARNFPSVGSLESHSDDSSHQQLEQDESLQFAVEVGPDGVPIHYVCLTSEQLADLARHTDMDHNDQSPASPKFRSFH